MKVRWTLLALLLVALTALPSSSQTKIQVQNAGTNVFFGTGYFKMNFASGCTASNVSGVLTISCTGAGGLSGGTTNGVIYATAPGAITTLTPPATNCIWNVIYNVTASAAVAPSTGCPGVTVNTPATPYTLLYSDRATYQRLTGGSTFAFTLCQITGTCASNLPFVVQNGNSGLLTFTANAADKIDNSATGGTSTLLSNFAAFVYQDSSSAPGNWWTLKFPTFSAFGTTCANALTWSTSTGFGCSGTLGGSLTVNGAGSATNLSSTTPAAGSNGINATIQILGANASIEIVGDGTASHYLDGTGAFSTPAGAANLYAWWSPATGASSMGAVLQNTTKVWGFVLPQSVSGSTGICYSVQTADNTANLYDIGIYNTSGTLIVHTGATAGTTLFASAATRCTTWTASATVSAGRSYIALTSSAASPAAVFGGTIMSQFASAVTVTGGTTSGGALNGSVTSPADSWASGNMVNFSLH